MVREPRPCGAAMRAFSACVMVLLVAAMAAANDDVGGSAAFNSDGYRSFSQFTPCAASALVDGQDYFERLGQALDGAKSSIMVTGWKVHPDVPLTGRDGKGQGRTLKDYVAAAVQRGVRVHALMWTSEWEKAQQVATRDFMNYRVDEGAAILREAGATVLIDEGHKQSPVDWLNMRWSQHQKVVIVDGSTMFAGGIDVCVARWDTRAHEFFHPLRVDHNDAPGKWGQIDMAHKPWHDLVLEANGDVARDVYNQFVDRWENYCGTTWFFQKWPPGCGKDGERPTKVPGGAPPAPGLVVDSECQGTRTAGGWNFGLKAHEQSIMDSYVAAIEQARHFIYIEQQYFCSAPKAHNSLAAALLARLDKAIRARQVFRVVVIVPFALEETRMVYPNQQTIVLYKESLVPRLRALVASLAAAAPSPEVRAFYERLDLEDYLMFNTLGIFHAVPEQAGEARFRALFVHSKLMIVDDRVVLLGSANANDRSFFGDRDSELNVVVRPAAGVPMVDSTMGGKPFKVGAMAHKLRVGLWAEHLGLAGTADGGAAAVADPLGAGFQLWRTKAAANSGVAKDVFGIDPPRMVVEVDHDKLLLPDSYHAAGVPAAAWARVRELTVAHSHLLQFPYDTWGLDAKKLESFMNDVPFLKEMFLSADADSGSGGSGGPSAGAAPDRTVVSIATMVVAGGVAVAIVAFMVVTAVRRLRAPVGQADLYEPLVGSAGGQGRQHRSSSGGIRYMEAGGSRPRKSTLDSNAEE